jgi:putative flippase GtrA
LAGLGYLLSTALSVEAAILHGFFWHHCWTWRERRLSVRLTDLLLRAVRYNLAVGILAFTVNLGIMRGLVEGFGVHYLLAGLVATVCAGLLNFLISDSFIFVQATPLVPRP